MIINRGLIFVWSLCLTLIGIASIVRFSNLTPLWQRTQPQSVDNVAGMNTNESLLTEGSFYGSRETSDIPDTEAKPNATPIVPVISARAYLAGNVMTKEIYMEKNSNTALPVASMSKLITAFTVTDMLSSSTIVTVTSEEANNMASDTSKIMAGESFSIKELLYPLLMNSSNIAAEALASSSDRVKFMESMLGYAWEVGMPKTFFADPSGISPKNVSTARDFFALAQYLYKSRQDILAITRIPTLSISTSTFTTVPSISGHGAHVFTSIHPFVNDQNFLGGKTGHTEEARDTMLTIMNINDRPVAIIVIASNNRKKDTAMIIEKVKKMMDGK